MMALGSPSPVGVPELAAACAKAGAQSSSVSVATRTFMGRSPNSHGRHCTPKRVRIEPKLPPPVKGLFREARGNGLIADHAEIGLIHVGGAAAAHGGGMAGLRTDRAPLL